MIDAAAAQRFVQFAGAVGGENHDRPLVGADRAAFRNRYLEVGQKFQQERFEFVVRAVDFVDQQHGLLRPPQAGQHRPLDQEFVAVNVDVAVGTLLAQRRASGAENSIRKAPPTRRCPRSIAGAAACGRARRRLPWRLRSCRRRARLRATTACRARARDRRRSKARRRRGNRRPRSASSSSRGLPMPTIVWTHRHVRYRARAAGCERCRARLQRAQNFLRGYRQIVDAHADGVEDRVGDRRQHRIGAHLAGTLGAERTVGRGPFQHDDVVRADVARAGHQILVEIARAFTGIRDNTARASHTARGSSPSMSRRPVAARPVWD